MPRTMPIIPSATLMYTVAQVVKGNCHTVASSHIINSDAITDPIDNPIDPKNILSDVLMIILI
jgi:hypothetical protein